MFIIVGIGGILGAVTRFLLGTWITRRTSASFPFGTWIINLTGSFCLGVMAAFYLQHQLPEWLWSFLGIGFLGAYTTFSTFGVEAVRLYQRKEIRTAILYVTTSVALGIFSAFIGAIMVITA